MITPSEPLKPLGPHAAGKPNVVDDGGGPYPYPYPKEYLTMPTTNQDRDWDKLIAVLEEIEREEADNSHDPASVNFAEDFLDSGEDMNF